MKTKAVKRIVGNNIERMMRLMGLQAWAITVHYEECSNTKWSASCERHLPYQAATIVIDPAKAYSPLGVLLSLRHELIHVALASFDLFFGVAQRLTANQEGADALAFTWTQCVEGAVLQIERGYDWSGDNPLSAEALAEWLSSVNESRTNPNPEPEETK